MPMITNRLVKALQFVTGASTVECKLTLEQCNGDFDKARAIITQRQARGAPPLTNMDQR